jgi:hypothetical protein
MNQENIRWQEDIKGQQGFTARAGHWPRPDVRVNIHQTKRLPNLNAWWPRWCKDTRATVVLGVCLLA